MAAAANANANANTAVLHRKEQEPESTAHGAKYGQRGGCSGGRLPPATPSSPSLLRPAESFPCSPRCFCLFRLSFCLLLRLQAADCRLGAASCDWQCVFVQQPAPEPWISGVAKRLALARNTLYVCGNARIYPGRPPAVTFIVAGGCVWGRAQRAVRDCSLRPAVRN